MEIDNLTPTVGLDNSGNVVTRNRAWRRRRKTASQLDGLSKKYHTTKQTIKRRKKNGKIVKVRKKSVK